MADADRMRFSNILTFIMFLLLLFAFVGNLEQVTNDRHRDVLVTRLVELGRTQTVVTASVNGVHDHPVRHLEVPNASRTELAGVQNGGE